MKFSLFPYLLIKTYGFGAQRNYPIDTILLSTYTICFGWEIIKIIFNYAILNGGMTWYLFRATWHICVVCMSVM